MAFDQIIKPSNVFFSIDYHSVEVDHACTAYFGVRESGLPCMLDHSLE